MAHLIPHLSSCARRMQAGEKRLAERLVSHLGHDCVCWYDLPVGTRHRYADFIVLDPRRGLLMLEVKDWKAETIAAFDKFSVTLRTPQGLKAVRNPLEQVRQGFYRLGRIMEQDPLLVTRSSQRLGSLAFPYGYGVVLSSMTRKVFETIGLHDVLPRHYTLCRDEMTETVSPEAFEHRLWNMANVECSCRLTSAQIDRIRWYLFPEIRIRPEQRALVSQELGTGESEESPPDLIKILDLQQEQLARSLGDGHRVIHGVAGSGKTLILLYRCIYLAEWTRQPILLICFNIALATWLRERLREMMAEHGLSATIDVAHFHEWCGRQLRLHGIDRLPPGDGYCEQMVAAVAEAVEAGRIPRSQYGAVLIDEGHDFEPDWLRVLATMSDPEAGSLLLVYDDAQSIYRRNKPLGFTLSSVGIHARGRTTVLRMNYRNTDEILTFAHRFVSEWIPQDDRFGQEPPMGHPVPAGRHGPLPAVHCCTSFDAEIALIARTLRHLHDERDLSWADMCVLYRSTWMAERVLRGLIAEEIPCECLKNAQAKKAFRLSHDSVKLMTLHSSKGLEFSIATIVGLGYMPATDADPIAEAKLLYVAMTRATDRVVMTAHRKSVFVQKLQELAARFEGESVACLVRS